MTEPEMIDSLRVHRFEPGDRLLVKVPEYTPHAEVERIKLLAWQWSGVPVLVMSRELEIEVARGLPEVEVDAPLKLWLEGLPLLAPNVEISNTGYLRGLPPEGEPQPAQGSGG